jgi:hypothetical protein
MQTYLLDDFNRPDSVATIGARWRSASDRVMGGISQEQAIRQIIDGRPCLRLRGRVLTANNGGFIQIALLLAGFNRAFDASAYRGVRVLVWGNDEEYRVHLRTLQTRQPWQVYQAAFRANQAWQDVQLPFAHFTPRSLQTPLQTRDLTQIAIIASGREFDADIAVGRIEFYS